jgi:hypothetical protein
MSICFYSVKRRVQNEDRIRREKLYNYRKQLQRSISSLKKDENIERFLRKKISNIENQLL